jgi:RND superfamily putative drug exporter
MLVSLARWCARHRLAVVAIWLVAVVVASLVSHSLGSAYVNNFSAPGTDSQRAIEVLERDFPAQSGDRSQIVFHVRDGTLSDPAVRFRVDATLRDVARLPHVNGVGSPYDRGGGAITRDGTIGFATIDFDQEAQSLPKEAVEKVISTAQAITSPQVEVELGGRAIAETEQTSPSSATAIGLIAATVVLLVAFGSLWAMVLPIVTALFGLGSAVAVITLASNAIDLAKAAEGLALMLGLGVGVDYALFVVTRYREAYRANGGDVGAAVEQAMNTAGRAVVFAALTVVIAILAMITLGIDLLCGIAVATSVSVLSVLASSVTLLPALLTFAGHRIGRPGRLSRTTRGEQDRFWGRWIGAVQRRPWPAAVAATLILLLLTAPLLGLRLGASDPGNGPASQTTRRAYDLLSEGFGPGFNGPLLVVTELPRPGETGSLGELETALRHTAGVESVTPPRPSPSRSAATLSVYPTSSPQSADTADLVDRLRDEVIPPVASRTGATVYIGGATATQVDFAALLATKFWYFVAAVIALSAALLLVVFRSLLIPLQAAIMNLLAIGAALGIAQAVFQRGWGAELFGAQPGPIEPFIPVLSFAIVFGLSMDYQVFLISRIHEEWVHQRDPTRAIHVGLTRTARVITAAAAVMVVVFVSFIAGGQRLLQLAGLTLASAVLLDALVIRCVLLPAVLQLAGRATWAFPRRLDNRLPRLAIEPGNLAEGKPASAQRSRGD